MGCGRITGVIVSWEEVRVPWEGLGLRGSNRVVPAFSDIFFEQFLYPLILNSE